MGNQQSRERDHSVRIANQTELPLVYVISQLGPLYWGVLQPGQRATRVTGRVWFTVTCYPYTGDNEPSTHTAVLATLVPVAAALGVVATGTGGLALVSTLCSSAPAAGTGTATAALSPLLSLGPLSGSAAGAVVAKGAAVVDAVRHAKGLVASVDDLARATDKVEKAGHYADGAWIHVRGGPKKDVDPGLWTPLCFRA